MKPGKGDFQIDACALCHKKEGIKPIKIEYTDKIDINNPVELAQAIELLNKNVGTPGHHYVSKKVKGEIWLCKSCNKWYTRLYILMLLPFILLIFACIVEIFPSLYPGIVLSNSMSNILLLFFVVIIPGTAWITFFILNKRMANWHKMLRTIGGSDYGANRQIEFSDRMQQLADELMEQSRTEKDK